MADDRLPFRAEENALIKFGDPGTAPLLNYNVPQPAEYTGRYFLDLALPPDALKPAPTKPTAPAAEQRPGRKVGRSTEKVDRAGWRGVSSAGVATPYAEREQRSQAARATFECRRTSRPPSPRR